MQGLGLPDEVTTLACCTHDAPEAAGNDCQLH